MERVPRVYGGVRSSVGRRPGPGPEAGAEAPADAGQVPAAAHLVGGVRPGHVSTGAGAGWWVLTAAHLVTGVLPRRVSTGLVVGRCCVVASVGHAAQK